MENKTMKYVIGIAVISVWGLLTFRIYARYFPEDEIVFPLANQEPEYDDTHVQDSFVIAVDYRDPFLSKKFKSVKGKSNTRKVNARKKPLKKQPKKEKPVVFPEIKYQGSVNETNADNKTALVSIDNQFISWKKGEVYNGLNLLKVYPDSIKVELRGEQKVISKKR